jgi:predicted permease
LGIQPELGREFLPSEEIPGNSRQVIISDRLWRTRFAAAPDIIGRAITLNAMPFTVVGVVPAGTVHPGNEYRPLAYGEDVDAWSPLWIGGDPSQRGSHYAEAIGRMKDGASPDQAKAELNALMAEMAREYEGDRGWQVLVFTLESEVVGNTRQTLFVLLGAVIMVLLVACANTANLLLARAASRQRELAVRMALGANRSRLIWQLLTESLLIASIGGVLGFVIAVFGVKALVSLLPSTFPRIHEIHISLPVFGLTLLVSLATGLLFGVAPALLASHANPRQGLSESGRTAIGSRNRQRLRNGLVVSEIALSCVLLIGAGIMLHSLLNLLELNPGFRKDHLLTATLSLPGSQYKDDASVTRFYERLVSDLRAIPGVESAGAGTDLPWTGYDDNTSFNIEGKQAPAGEYFHARYHVATPDYFHALGIPLIQGRFLSDADKADSSKVVVINEAMANRFWPHQMAVGRRITFEDKPAAKDWLTVVGVVGDVKDKPNSAGAEPAFWWPHTQASFRNMVLIVRSASDPGVLADALRDEVHHLDPTLAVARLQWMDQIAQESIASPRIEFVLVGLFAALAILLAAIGVYGVISYAVNQRSAEFGLRLALGAQRRDLFRLVLLHGAWLVLPGVLAGAALALSLGRILRSLTYNVRPTDPLTFCFVVSLVLAIAFLACYLPARRATRANPLAVLRAE